MVLKGVNYVLLYIISKEGNFLQLKDRQQYRNDWDFVAKLTREKLETPGPCSMYEFRTTNFYFLSTLRIRNFDLFE